MPTVLRGWCSRFSGRRPLVPGNSLAVRFIPEGYAIDSPVSTVSKSQHVTLEGVLTDAELGARVKWLRENHKPAIRRTALGEVFGFTGDSANQAVREWEIGKRQIPAVFVPKLAECLGVSVAELFDPNLNQTSIASRDQAIERFVRDMQTVLSETDAEIVNLLIGRLSRDCR